MKGVLVTPRWRQLEGLGSPFGRPYLDLLLQGVGVTELALREVPDDGPFDPTGLEPEFGVILVQGARGCRLRRSLLSSLGLSLGLDVGEPERLRVVGAQQLHNGNGEWIGFVVRRRSRLVAYCEECLWQHRQAILEQLQHLRKEGGDAPRRGAPLCWMLEGNGHPLPLREWMGEVDAGLCRQLSLPDGDSALLLPNGLAEEHYQRLRQGMGLRLYATQPEPLEELLGRQLTRAGVRVATAESCTAGLVAARLASVRGASAWLEGGFITYSNDAKRSQLGVPGNLLESVGAVSPEVALAMARGAQRASGADLAVAVTGIAGPDGGSEFKPVGTVHLAAVRRDGGSLTRHMVYTGDRDAVRLQSSQTAMHLLRRLLENGDQG